MSGTFGTFGNASHAVMYLRQPFPTHRELNHHILASDRYAITTRCLWAPFCKRGEVCNSEAADEAKAWINASGERKDTALSAINEPECCTVGDSGFGSAPFQSTSSSFTIRLKVKQSPFDRRNIVIFPNSVAAMETCEVLDGYQ